VSHRTALILSLKNLCHRTHGSTLSASELKAFDPEDIKDLFDHPADQMIAEIQKQHIERLTESIGAIEKESLKGSCHTGYHVALKTIPGIGIILAMTIALETGKIERFKAPEHFASYCRTVKSQRVSNGRPKGENNSKNGNPYLAWAFVEASNFTRQYDSPCRQWFDRKTAKRGGIVATKALAGKLAKVAWPVMRSGKPYDSDRIFPTPKRHT
jgi:transposase